MKFAASLALQLGFVVHLSACAAGGDEASCSSSATSNDEYAVLTGLIRERFVFNDGSPVVVVQETEAAAAFGDFVDEFRSRVDVDTGAAADLLQRNAETSTLQADQFGDLGVSLHLVQADEVPSFEEPTSAAWDNFEQQFGSRRAISVSRPGLGCDEAIVYAMSECGFCARQGSSSC